MKRKRQMPGVFAQLIEKGLIDQGAVLSTEDGFFAVYRSLSELLAQRKIFDFPDPDGVILSCDRFFDDWYLYAVAHAQGYVYSLFKMREQEFDAQDGGPADGDTPGVTVCFIEFSVDRLLECLARPTAENRRRLDGEINRVVAHRGQRHHRELKAYFVDPGAQGAYLIGRLYIRRIAAMAEKGALEVPVHYGQVYQQSLSYKRQQRLRRLPDFLEELNRQAGYTVCNHEKIYIRDPAAPTREEGLAILATHTGNVSLWSFAAEVEYHARFLVALARVRLPFFGGSVYASAIRADMSIDDREFEGTAPFHRPESRLVRRQKQLHSQEYLDR